jgi:predicted RNA-binding Zn-ribbon protein involved in translation (DUF1610 family)
MDRRCLSCRHCGAGLWIRYPDAYPTVAAKARIDRREAIFRWDHYLKDRQRPLSHAGRDVHLLYLPFWRVCAIVAISHDSRLISEPDAALPFVRSGCSGEGYGLEPKKRARDDEREVPWDIKPWDYSFPAFDQGLWGLDSLGVRTQTIALGGCDDSPSSETIRWWPPNVSADQTVHRLSDAVVAILAQTRGSDTLTPKIMAPQISLIYWPVWVLTDRGSDSGRSVEIDAVSGRVIREVPHTPRLPERGGNIEGEAPRLLAHRCPSCGADLPVDHALTAFPCSNCGVLVAHVASGDRRITTCEFSGNTARRDSHWYPFWVFEPGEIMVPAFPGRNLRALLRFGAVASGQKRASSVSDSPPVRQVGVALLPDIAAGLAELIQDQRSQSPQPLSAAPPRLVFIPLETQNGELVDLVTGRCLSRAALAPF